MMLDPFFDFPDNVLYSKNISEGEHFLHAPSFWQSSSRRTGFFKK